MPGKKCVDLSPLIATCATRTSAFSRPMTQALVAQVGAGIPLLSLAASGEPRPPRPPVTPLPMNPGLPAAIPLEKAVRGSVAINSDESDGKPSWQVNGRRGSPGMPPLLRVPKGARSSSPSTSNLTAGGTTPSSPRRGRERSPATAG